MDSRETGGPWTHCQVSCRWEMGTSEEWSRARAPGGPRRCWGDSGNCRKETDFFGETEEAKGGVSILEPEPHGELPRRHNHQCQDVQEPVRFGDPGSLGGSAAAQWAGGVGEGPGWSAGFRGRWRGEDPALDEPVAPKLRVSKGLKEEGMGGRKGHSVCGGLAGAGSAAPEGLQGQDKV